MVVAARAAAAARATAAAATVAEATVAAAARMVALVQALLAVGSGVEEMVVRRTRPASH